MCKHDGLWIEAIGTKKIYCSDGFNETSVRRSICGQCYRTKTEIDLEAQLAAANAEITKLRASYSNCEEEKGEKYEKSI